MSYCRTGDLPSQGLIKFAQTSTSYARPLSSLTLRPSTGTSRTLVKTHAKASPSDNPTPPKPNTKFSRQDLKRIKQQGPSVQDLHIHFDIEGVDKEGSPQTTAYDFVPADVLGDVDYASEPNWYKLSQMTYMEFYQGLRERNWTSDYYDPAVEKWDLKFFRDSGRFMRPAFSGYRVHITKADGNQSWVNLDRAGADSYLRDYSGGGSKGAIHQNKRVSQQLLTPAQYGYNQVFEQLFQAYEQRIPSAARREQSRKGWINPSKHEYVCPADAALSVSFNLTPQEPTLHTVWENLPAVAFYAFGVSFLGIALAIGIFRPRRQMPTDMFQAMEFAQSKGNARKDGSTGMKFADVGGLGPAVHEMMEVVKFLKDPVKYASLEARPPKGILLSGDPGVGKTLIAKAIAGEAGVPFYQMAGSEFVEAIVGVGAARVRDLFKRARAQAPCIVFVDEIDALGIRRAGAGVKTNEEREQTLNQLLSEMDGFTPDTGVVFVAATNRPDLLDAALVRAGRFDRKIIIRRPDEAGREEILKIHARKHKVSPDVDLRQLAKDLPGLSGAELANVLNEAALEAVRRDGSEVIPADVYNAVDRVLQGIRRPSLPDRFKVKRSMAVHEAGTALIASLLHTASGRIEEVERVSMVPRGRDWTRTIYARGRDEDYLVMTRGRLMDRVKVVLAGRAAEEVALGVPSTYGVADIRDATRLALRVVANYGLSELGITTYAPPPSRLGFLQRSFEVTVDNIDADLFGTTIPGGSYQPSDNSWHTTKSTAATIVKQAYVENVRELMRRRAALDQLTDALMAKETVAGEEVVSIIDANRPVELPESMYGDNDEERKEKDKQAALSSRSL